MDVFLAYLSDGARQGCDGSDTAGPESRQDPVFRVVRPFPDELPCIPLDLAHGRLFDPVFPVSGSRGVQKPRPTAMGE